MAGLVLVFDFDKTIIDCDSDEWVVAELGVNTIFHQLSPTMPWNRLMDKMMKEIYLQGNTIEDIAECLRRAPLDSHVINGIRAARALGCELRVVSDANNFFIETILNHHGLLGYFSEINTNLSYVDEHGQLRILPYHDSTSPPHGCTLCPTNMCKGKIVDRIISSTSEEEKRFIYLGDGKGDYCPSLRLSEDDHVMPRKKYPLWELINENAEMVKAKVHEWSNGEELKMTLLQLIDASLPPPATITRLSPVDCKLERMPMVSHALPVPRQVFSDEFEVLVLAK